MNDPQRIQYYDSQEDAEKPDPVPIGTIELENFRGVWRCETEQREGLMMIGRQKFPFVFRLETTERKWILASEDSDAVEEWICALRKALQDNASANYYKCYK